MISKYGKSGEYFGPAIETDILHDITAFSLQSPDYFWVADMGGQRLVGITADGGYAEKYSYCYFEAEFEFQEINDIYFYNYVVPDLVILDCGPNSIAKFTTVEYFCHTM